MEYLGYQLIVFAFVNYFGSAYIVINGAKSTDPATIIMWMLKQDLRTMLFIRMCVLTAVSFLFMGLGIMFIF